MPIYRIQLINKDFQVSNEIDQPDLEAALRAGLKGALAIGAEEICDGQPFFGAEVIIALDGDVLERRMIAVGASPLQ